MNTIRFLAKVTGFLFFLLGSGRLAADIEMSESLVSVFFRGEQVLAGALTISVQGNDFSGASVNDPKYIRIELGLGAVLAENLVDLTSPDERLSTPIFLAMTMASNKNARLVAAPDTVSLVRWVAGESEFWIRVQSDSGQWVEQAGQLTAPNEACPISWSLGIHAGRSAELVATIPLERKNLPFNSRDPLLSRDSQDFAKAVSTNLCVDLKQSSLAASGSNAFLFYLPSAQGFRAETSVGVYKPIDPLAVIFSGNFEVAEGRDRHCGASLKAASYLKVCPEPDAAFSEVRSLVEFRANCVQGNGFLETVLRNGARLRLSSRHGLIGFKPDLLITTGPTSWEIQKGDRFSSEGHELYRTIELLWTGGVISLKDLSLELELTTGYAWEEGPQEIVIEWSFQGPSGAANTNEPPLDGLDQRRGCSPDLIFFGQGETVLGNFGCRLAGRRVIPHVTRQNGGFRTLILVTNQGQAAKNWAFEGYDAEGNFLAFATGGLTGKETARFELVDLFGLALPESFLISTDPGVTVIAEYQALRLGSGPAHVPEKSTWARGWLLYPGNPRVTWDGIAAVNMGDRPTEVRLFQVDSRGVKTTEHILDQSLAPGAKLLSLLGEEDVQIQGVYFYLEADQPLALIALRGDRSSTFLWESVAVPFLP